MNIPFLDLKAVLVPHRAEIEAAISDVLDSGQTILGPQVSAFEDEFARYCGVRHAIGVASGLDALILMLRGLGLAPGDEVIVPANTYIATVLAVTAAGCTPVLADPDPHTMALDPLRVERLVTARTRAVIAVHLYGRVCDMSELRAVCARHGLRLLEDAAQAHGAVEGDRHAGALGDAAAFSFYPTKNLGALGDGGAVTTDDDAVAARIRMLRNYGSVEKNVHVVKGVNSRLDELQAAVLRVRLRHLDDENDRRRRIAARYATMLADTGLDLPDWNGKDHVFHLYVVRSGARDALAAGLAVAGIGTAIHYPVPPHRQPAYREMQSTHLPVAELLAGEVLSLPANPSLSEDQQERVAEVLRALN